MPEPTRPIMRYHGGKWMLAPWIVEHMPQHRYYIEPFCGAASVLLRKPRSYSEVISDLNGELMNMFRVARDHGPELCQLLELTPFHREEYALACKKSRNKIEQARRTIVRSYFGFGSNSHNQVTGWRSGVRASGATPWSDWRTFPPQLVATIERLQGVAMETRPALQVIEQNDHHDALFYLDPPYVRASRDAGRDYKHELTDDGHRRMAKVLHGLEGMVMLSGYRSKLYDELFGDWHREEKAALADGGRKRTEVLWMNPAAMARHPSPGLFTPITITPELAIA